MTRAKRPSKKEPAVAGTTREAAALEDLVAAVPLAVLLALPVLVAVVVPVAEEVARVVELPTRAEVTAEVDVEVEETSVAVLLPVLVLEAEEVELESPVTLNCWDWARMPVFSVLSEIKLIWKP
jgi:hypothetical protein